MIFGSVQIKLATNLKMFWLMFPLTRFNAGTRGYWFSSNNCWLLGDLGHALEVQHFGSLFHIVSTEYDESCPEVLLPPHSRRFLFLTWMLLCDVALHCILNVSKVKRLSVYCFNCWSLLSLLTCVSSDALGREEVVVEYKYDALHDDELTLQPGDIIKNVRYIEEDGWMEGDLNGKRGLFPDNFVKVRHKTSLIDNKPVH